VGLTSDPFICLAVITSPHGVSGRVKVKSFTTPPASFVDFSTLCDESGAPVRLRISGQAGGCFIATIDGITTREEAAFLRGRKLGVPRSALPEPQAGEVYLADLIGMEVVTRMGESFGKVVRFYNFGAGDILEIRTAGGREEMFSFTEANFPSIDRARRTLTISPPDILKADPA
jgi:16S rRNA processing protein RimM